VPTRDEHVLIGHLGPDILGPDWNLELAVANVVAHPGTIAAALLDQRSLAGIGTFYACETLYLEGRSPWAPAASLDRDAVATLIARAARLMRANTNHAVQSTTGLRLRGENSYVHGRLALPCRRCGEPVRAAASGAGVDGRVIFYCRACQGGLAPTDAGSRQRPLGAGERKVRPPTQRPRRRPEG
jgi:endonuclease-8